MTSRPLSPVKLSWAPVTREDTMFDADVQMRGMSGPQLQEHLIDSGVKIPVIFITLSSQHIRDRVLKRGAIGYLASIGPGHSAETPPAGAWRRGECSAIRRAVRRTRVHGEAASY